MDISLPGLVGAIAGLVVGLINYGAIAALVEQKFRQRAGSWAGGERRQAERRMLLVKRIVFVVDIVAFSLIGYWFGRTIGG